MKPLGRWLAETRMGRAVFRLAILGFGAVAVAALIWIEVSHEVDQQTGPLVQRIEVIERVEPADVLRECLGDRECRQLIRSVRERLERTERGDARQPAPSAGQQPEPGVRPGGREGSKPQRPGRDRGRPPRRPGTDRPTPTPPPPAAQSAPAPSPSTPPAASPKAEPPGPLAPPLDAVQGPAEETRETVCSVADHLLELC